MAKFDVQQLGLESIPMERKKKKTNSNRKKLHTKSDWIACI